MYATGVSFRSLSTILDLSFATANTENRFSTSTGYLFKNYKRLLRTKEGKYKDFLREDQSLGTICFDHQATQKITGKYEGTTHRIAVVWYSKEKHNGIGMKEMPDKTAESQTRAIREICTEYGIDNSQIVALTCDNENTNVGIRGGTCTLFEQALNKLFLRLMCRHHIPEIVIKDVYHYLFKSDTPNNLFYPILKEIWPDLRETGFNFEPFDENLFFEEFGVERLELFKEMKNRAILELRQHSKSNHVRDDYREVSFEVFWGESSTNKRK